MPARSWKWRMQGGAVTLAKKSIALVESGMAPDLILATDMLNLPVFLALARDCVPRVPVVLLMHENQLTYPLPDGADRDLTYAWINYLSCLSADHVVFNSEFHRREFLEALPSLLKAFPDYRHAGNIDGIGDRSSVLHLGVDLTSLEHRTTPPNGISETSEATRTLLWNQRWEYDRNPAAFFRLVDRLDEAGCDFQLILAGEQFGEEPSVFRQAIHRHAARIVHNGFADSVSDYGVLLHAADIVVSTSIHEFFGVAIIEAIYCGCHPLLPNRLSYPELIPQSLRRSDGHAPVLYETEDELFDAAVSLLTGQSRPLDAARLKSEVAHLDWRSHAKKFDELIEQVARPSPITPG